MKHNRIKKRRLSIFSVFLGTLIFYSCDKVDSAKSIPPPSTNMIADIGGQTMSFNGGASLNGTFSNVLYIQGDYTGTNSEYNNSQLQFTIVNYNPNYIGSYKLGYCNSNINPPNHSSATYQTAPWSQVIGILFSYTTDSTSTGVLTITSYNPTYHAISGTFSLKCHLLFKSPGYADSLDISNGTFFVQL